MYYLIRRLEQRVGYICDAELLMIGLLSRDDWSVGDQREVNPGVGYQVGLELSQINVQSTVKSERSGDRRNNL